MAASALALLLLAPRIHASCAGNCAAPLNVTCGSVLIVGDSTTAEYARVELRVLLEDLGVGPIYVADPESSGPCGSSFGLASCIAPYLAHKWSVIVLGWAHRDIKANVYGVVTVDEYRSHLWQTYASLITSLAPGGSFVFMTSVPVGASYDKRDNADAVQLNSEALSLLQGEDIVIVDLYERIVAACRRDRAFLAPVENQHAAHIALKRNRLRPIHQKQHGSGVRIFFVVAQIDRLLTRRSVLCGSMGQKGIVAVGPQMRIQGADALGATDLHFGAPPPLQRAFQEVRQHPLQVRADQVIEQNLRHGGPPARLLFVVVGHELVQQPHPAAQGDRRGLQVLVYT